jgi:hypothetical protein
MRFTARRPWTRAFRALARLDWAFRSLVMWRHRHQRSGNHWLVVFDLRRFRSGQLTGLVLHEAVTMQFTQDFIEAALRGHDAGFIRSIQASWYLRCRPAPTVRMLGKQSPSGPAKQVPGGIGQIMDPNLLNKIARCDRTNDAIEHFVIPFRIFAGENGRRTKQIRA